MHTIIRTTAVLAALCSLLNSTTLLAQRAIFVDDTYTDGAFNLQNAEIPSWEIIPAGTGRDGIPAIDEPVFTHAKNDRFLKDEEPVIGMVINGVAKAYPVRILSMHEVVNDNFGNQAVAVTYSPLSGSALAYQADGEQEDWSFAVSGLLYNSNLLFYDRQTESLWSQVLGRAVAGPAVGQQLPLLPTTYTTWGEWRRRHPETLALTTETGFGRNYDKDPYAQYASSDRLMFPVSQTDKRLALKTRVLGIEIDGYFKAYPYSALAAADNFLTEDQVNGVDILIEFVPTAQAAYVTDAAGNPLPSASLYWFSWSAFHPETEVYGLPANGPTTISMTLGAL